ncbi:MAG: DUF3418 domain-containing protein, partial [Chromatiaceae bacterium]|nr:DUF3418 domain-containing protein [Chromatiaceae bacterium]
IGRMLLAADAHACLAEVLVIAAALSVQDPRERPTEQRQAADEMHATFAHPESDFLTFLNLWDFLERERHALSRNQFTKLCQRHFLSWNRVQEWRDIHTQLREQLLEMGFRERCQTPAASREPSAASGQRMAGSHTPEAGGQTLDADRFERIHRALLSGLLVNIGFREGAREFEGARGARFQIHPGSALFKAPPKWVVVAERVETTRHYGRIAARVQPGWIEAAGAHLLQRSYSEPHWQAKAGQVAAFERVTLFGVTLVARRRVNYGPINPVEAREIFLRFALTEGDFETRAPFWRHNRELIDFVHHLEAKSRRRDILVDEEAIHAFYAARVPSGIYSTPQFERWLREATRAEPKLLHMRLSDLMRTEAEAVTAESFPDQLAVGASALPLEYRFEPGESGDGVTLVTPLELLNQVSAERLDWLVPGLLGERIEALLRGLPKSIRKSFVPIPDTAARLVARLKPSERPLIQALGEELRALTGVQVPEDAWNPDAVPEHLRMKVRVVDDSGRTLAADTDVAALRRQLGGKARARFAEQRPEAGIERAGLRRWDFGDLPEEVELKRAGIRLRGFPALVDHGESVAIEVLDTAERAAEAHRLGLRRLILLHLGEGARGLRKGLAGLDRLRLQYAKAAPAPEGAAPDLADEILALILDRAFIGADEPPRTQADFERALREGRARLEATRSEVMGLIATILDRYQAVRKRLAAITQVQWMASVLDARAQLDALVYRGCFMRAPWARLGAYPRYLRALEQRLERLPLAAARDRQWLAELAPLQERWRERLKAAEDAGRRDERLEEIRWLLEELRVSLFAQQLGTAQPVSVKRIEARWRELGL